ncbi:hypothetical protein MNBD_GAMMA10-2284 [hydrothermal vent metagenome]|uniref:Tat (Twin-arginine translocation) pathway signal sequence domain protein n=1 Tax=hydrothermal vent metagenome TaxID=652676 RepID=A0A3B0XBZ1_9ZZZZ
MKHTNLINRRQFIQLLSALSAGWSATSLAVAKSVSAGSSDTDYKNLKEPWLTLAQVQEHLFPADETSPGAKDINALRFLRNMQQAPDTDAEEKKFIEQGVGWLNDLSVKEHQSVFRQLDDKDKESVLRRIESSRAGSRWLALIMTNLIEALLSDPVYGGNQQGKGWKWLEHQPGFPAPTPDKVYFKLDTPSRRRTKA